MKWSRNTVKVMEKGHVEPKGKNISDNSVKNKENKQMLLSSAA